MPLDTNTSAVIDAEAAAPSGKLCGACGTPVEALDKFCPACGTTNPAYRQQVDNGTRSVPATTKHFKCQQCGAEVATDPDQRSYICPFCDSTYVMEFSPAETGRQPPEFVIGFAVTSDQAQQTFRQWLRANSWFRPGDLAVTSVAEKMKGVYLPFWSFTMLAQSQWQAQIGEYWYRTETYTERDSKGNLVTKTRQVRETEWWPLAGRHHRYYSGYLVSGSKGLAQDQSLRIQPFNLPALKRYEPYFLAGWLAEEYSVGREEALSLCQEEFQRQEQRNVASFLPGDTHSGLAVATEFSQVSSDLCLLPTYILSYRYRDKVYRFLLNGQTGKHAGDKPISAKRITALIAAILAILLLLGLLALIFAPKASHQRPLPDLPAEAPMSPAP